MDLEVIVSKADKDDMCIISLSNTESFERCTVRVLPIDEAKSFADWLASGLSCKLTILNSDLDVEEVYDSSKDAKLFDIPDED